MSVTRRTITAYSLSSKNFVALELPAGAEILDVGVDRGRLVLFCLVDPEERIETRIFLALPANWLIAWPAGMIYRGAALIELGVARQARFVFEVTGPLPEGVTIEARRRSASLPAARCA